MSVQNFEVAIRGADAVAADPLLLPMIARANAAIAAAGLTATDAFGLGATLHKTLRGSDGARWDLTLVRSDAGAWVVETIESDDAQTVEWYGDVVFVGDKPDDDRNIRIPDAP